LRPDGGTPWRLVIEPRRISRRMRKQQRAIDDLVILHEVRQRAAALRAKGQRSMKRAVTDVATKFGTGIKTIEAAVTRARKILKNARRAGRRQRAECRRRARDRCARSGK